MPVNPAVLVNHTPPASHAAPLIRMLSAADTAAYRAQRLRMLREHPQAFRSSAAAEADRPDAWFAARLTQDATGGHLFLGAFAAQELIGSVGLAFEDRAKTRHTATLIGMYVAAEHGGRGVGAALLAACLAAARAHPGLELVLLTVTSTNAAAIRLYERAGFVIYGVEPRSMKIGGDYFDKTMMWLALN